MTDIPSFAPGCFGSALTFKSKDLVCKACSFAAACEPVHLRSKMQLREKFGLGPEKVITAPTVDPAKAWADIAIALPAKVRRLLERLDAGNYDVVGKLSRRENPFGAAMPFMAVTCALLLGLKRPLDRETLTTSLMKHFSWQRSTASEHARIATIALVHVGAVRSVEGTMTLKDI